MLLCGSVAEISAFKKQSSTPGFDPLQTAEIYLSGHGPDDAVEWDFMCTGGRNSGTWTKIKVPSCWEQEGFGIYQYGMPFYGKANPPGIANEKGLYKTRFKLPAEWEGRIIRLVFEGVMTDCSAEINKRRAVKLHQGAFYRFYADVSDRVFFGDKENLLEVTVSKESENSSVNLAERRADYWNFGGIFRPVFIQALPAQSIDRTAIDAKADGSFYAEVFLSTALEGDYSVETQLLDREGKNIGKALKAELRPGSDKVIVKGQFTDIKTWTAETPHLYDVQFSLLKGKEAVHIVKEQRIGFRTIEVKESDGLYINGQKVMIKGVNRHSFRPETGRTLSREDNYNDVRLMREMNLNAVRLSHYPPDPAFLDACDELGLYVMNELGGWHGKYDTEVGKQLVKEMVTRDLNHPSIIWWSNGNEGGWNTELDGEFHPWDPQKRPVLHPQGNFGGFETMHYRSYGESQEYMRKPEIFMPTEILHGLYDGGHGAGLWDYWVMMRRHPRCAGAFLWVFADEGLMRTDQNGRIDNVGNYAADGIVGPHHEKEGSFFTVKEVWCPVQIKALGRTVTCTERTEALRQDQNSFIADPEAFVGKFYVENRYDFISLEDCRIKWSLANFAKPGDKSGGHNIINQGEQAGPKLAPHQSGEFQLKLPANWKEADVLYVSVLNPRGEEIYTWGWYWKSERDYTRAALAGQANTSPAKLSQSREGNTLTIESGTTRLQFDTETGYLIQISKGNNNLSFSGGPRFIAARRSDRSMDVFYNHDDKAAKSKDRIYADISGNSRLIAFEVEEQEDKILFKTQYFGNLNSVCWTITDREEITVDYEYQYEGVVELAGICFDYPEENMQGMRLLGKGPYRSWQNRMHGTLFDVWDKEYNDPIPGESFIYPEFKGYYNDWKWVDFQTAQAQLWLGNGTPGSFLGVYTPRDGRDALLYTIPQSGIAVLDVIPGVRNKVNSTDLVGPSSQAKWLSGPQKGSLQIQIR